jgi:Arc/MetJ-type ribon-helix-helix transcriptional regulator
MDTVYPCPAHLKPLSQRLAGAVWVCPVTAPFGEAATVASPAFSLAAMKVTIDMSNEDVGFLDAYASRHRLDGRSGAVRKAVELLRFSELGPAYERAWDEWHSSGEAAVWSGADKDGYMPESREAG